MTDMLKSKKFVALVAGIVGLLLTTLLGKLGVSVPEERVTEFVALVAAYVLGQGIADMGKGRAEAEAAARPKINAGGGGI